MGRKKRSQKLIEAGGQVVPAAAPVAVMPKVERIVSAVCSLCGRTIPQFRAIKIGSITVDHVNYFGSIDWDANKPFGISYLPAGGGSFKDWRPINPEDAPELFEAVKKRFLDALREWTVDKKWITREEVERSVS